MMDNWEDELDRMKREKALRRSESFVPRRSNLPDDYNMYWRSCHKCGRKFHASDGACDYCLEQAWKKEENERRK